MSETDLARYHESLAIRTAVTQDVAHAPQALLVHPPARIELQDADDSAHDFRICTICPRERASNKMIFNRHDAKNAR